jgi:hypothetical protein
MEKKGVFMRKLIKVDRNPSSDLLNRSYNSSLWVVAAFIIGSALNVISLAADLSYFSAFAFTLPYAILEYAVFMCGMYPPEYYEEIEAFTFWHESFYIYMMIAAFAVIAALVVMMILARKRNYKWLIVFMALTVADTLILYLHYGLTFSETILDIIWRVIFMFSLISGVTSAKLYGKTKAEEERKKELLELGEAANSTPLRNADMTVKHRILLEYKEDEHHIVYRRVGKVNELVIDGMVYDEYIALAEFAHELKATINGKDISAGYNGLATSYISINGIIVATKPRLI